MIAQILFDSGIRYRNNLIETSAQKLKDGGPDEFRKLAASAGNGVLFIDEAYDLNPAGDFKGAPIVSELIVISENDRDKLSIIIAGYEKDIEEKLYSYNDGIRSRFRSVMFEDFDYDDLLLIRNRIVKDQEWTADPRIGPMISKRLSLKANKPGFGNARSVRICFEDAIQKAMGRDDYQECKLEVIYIVGESPKRNEK